jgi:hypothetical protein
VRVLTHAVVGDGEFYGLVSGFWVCVGEFGHLGCFLIVYRMLRFGKELQIRIEAGKFSFYLNSG